MRADDALEVGCRAVGVVRSVAVRGWAGWRCPRCDMQMRLRAVVIHPPATTRITSDLAVAALPPPTPSALAG